MASEEIEYKLIKRHISAEHDSHVIGPLGSAVRAAKIDEYHVFERNDR